VRSRISSVVLRARLGVAAFTLAMLPFAASAQGARPDSVELAEARAVVEIMFPAAERDQMFATMIDQVLAQFRQGIPAEAVSEPGIANILNTYLDDVPRRLAPLVPRHMPHILDATAVAYTNEFSLPELQEIHRFAQTSAGRHYLASSAKLVGDPAVAAANAVYFADLQQMQQVPLRDLSGKIMTYVQDHPDAAAKLREGS